MNRDSQNTCGESPNDPKLSDGRAGHDPCATLRADENRAESEAATGGKSTGHDAPARSLERMVRRFGDCGITLTLEATNVNGVEWISLGAVKAIGGGVYVSV